MPASNRQETVRRHYASAEKLLTRIETHEKYSRSKVRFARWVIDQIEWYGDERLLDLGCGTGQYYPLLRASHPKIAYNGLDLSVRMLARHPAARSIIQADGLALPYADDTFDVVMANHMLYHVADIDGVLRAIRRVLRPDGLLVASANSVYTMPEFEVVFQRAVALLASPDARPRTLNLGDSFSLESGVRHLSRHFFAVARYDLPDALVFDSPEPAVKYLESLRDLRETDLPPGVDWDAMMALINEQITTMIRIMNTFIASKLSGVLVASDCGGFIADFVQAQGATDAV